MPRSSWTISPGLSGWSGRSSGSVQSRWWGLVVAAVLGVFGTGPIAWRETASASGELEVASPRFARRSGNLTMTVSADRSLASGSVFRVAIDQAYVDDLGFEVVRPEPDVVEAAGDQLVYVIARDNEDGRLEMTIDLTPNGLWSTSGVVRVGDQSVEREHFLFP